MRRNFFETKKDSDGPNLTDHRPVDSIVRDIRLDKIVNDSIYDFKASPLPTIKLEPPRIKELLPGISRSPPRA